MLRSGSEPPPAARPPLTNLIPSFAPSRQKLTSSGESFRGRKPLFLVDGVPQSNPLRDGQREGFTLGMEAVERIELVFGANAIQGLGATGGIVNFVTVSPARDGRLEQRASVSTSSNDGFQGDGLGWRGSYLAASGALSYLKKLRRRSADSDRNHKPEAPVPGGRRGTTIASSVSDPSPAAPAATGSVTRSRFPAKDARQGAPIRLRCSAAGSA